MKTTKMQRCFVAECTAGCTHQGHPRQIEAYELEPHDDKHLPPKVRVLVRMLRCASTQDRQAVMDYFAGKQPAFAKEITP